MEFPQPGSALYHILSVRTYIGFYLIKKAAFLSATKHQKIIRDLMSVNDKMKYSIVKMTMAPFGHVLQLKKSNNLQVTVIGLSYFHTEMNTMWNAMKRK